MLGKNKETKWTPESKQSFEDIKRAISDTPIVTSPDFSKYFLIFSFTSEHTVAGVLLQKNNEGHEKPITFYSKTLIDSPLKYNILDKQAYSLVWALKDFQVYILHSHIITHVPTTTVKDILTQPDIDGRRGKWIVVILEYDLEIKPRKLIKCHGTSQAYVPIKL